MHVRPSALLDWAWGPLRPRPEKQLGATSCFCRVSATARRAEVLRRTRGLAANRREPSTRRADLVDTKCLYPPGTVRGRPDVNPAELIDPFGYGEVGTFLLDSLQIRVKQERQILVPRLARDRVE